VEEDSVAVAMALVLFSINMSNEEMHTVQPATLDPGRKDRDEKSVD
jgi:hypothetical protein